MLQNQQQCKLYWRRYKYIWKHKKRGETRAKINSRWQPLEMARQWNKDFVSNSNHLSLVSNLMLQTAMRAI